MTNMAPSESRAAVLTLKNTGSTPFRVTATGTATGAELLPVINVRVVVGGTTTADTSYPRQETCGGGTEVYSGTLAGTPTVLPASAAVAPATGNGTATVCVQATLPTGTTNTNGQGAAVQGRSWQPPFTFLAEQTT